MTVKDMVYGFKLKADKLDSKAFMNLSLPAIIFLLNEGQMGLCLKRYSGVNTVTRASMEETMKRISEFQRIHVPDELLIATEIDRYTYVSDLTITKKPYMFLTRMNVFASKGKCDQRRLKGIMVQTDDMDMTDGSKLRDSSFEWGEVNYRIMENKLRMRSDGTFKIKQARIDYLRYPGKIDIAGYKDFEGVASTNKDCELPDFLHYSIIDEALVVYAESFTNADLQARLKKLSVNE